VSNIIFNKKRFNTYNVSMYSIRFEDKLHKEVVFVHRDAISDV